MKSFLSKVGPSQYLPLKTSLAMHMGKHLEEVLVTGLVEAIGKKNVYAKWVTEDGNVQQCWGSQIEKDSLAKVGMHQPDLVSPNGVITGHPDFLFSHADGSSHLLEIKTIAPDLFEALTGPNLDHKKQAIMYDLLFTSMGIRIDHTYVIYLNKSPTSGKKDVIKVFYIDKQDVFYQKLTRVINLVDEHLCPCTVCKN